MPHTGRPSRHLRRHGRRHSKSMKRSLSCVPKPSWAWLSHSALALALYGQGHLALVQGQNDRCQERWQTCAAVAQGVGNIYGLSYLQFRWGVIALLKLDLDRANA